MKGPLNAITQFFGEDVLLRWHGSLWARDRTVWGWHPILGWVPANRYHRLQSAWWGSFWEYWNSCKLESITATGTVCCRVKSFVGCHGNEWKANRREWFPLSLCCRFSLAPTINSLTENPAVREITVCRVLSPQSYRIGVGDKLERQQLTNQHSRHLISPGMSHENTQPNLNEVRWWFIANSLSPIWL